MNSKLLLVDDDVSVVHALSGVLRSEGYVVVQAYNGHQALECFREVSAGTRLGRLSGGAPHPLHIEAHGSPAGLLQRKRP